MTDVDPHGLEAAAKALGEFYGGRMAEDTPGAEAAVRAYLAAAVPAPTTENPPAGRLSPDAYREAVVAIADSPEQRTAFLKLIDDVFAAGRAAATPDPPPCRCPDDWRYDDGSVSCPRHPTKPDAPAASPDERLREAVAALPQYVITIQDREGYTYERGCEGQPMNYTGVMLADVEALVGKLKDGATTARETTNELKDAAADREKPEGCRAPHCFSEYGTPCGTCPAEKPETP